MYQTQIRYPTQTINQFTHPQDVSQLQQLFTATQNPAQRISQMIAPRGPPNNNPLAQITPNFSELDIAIIIVGLSNIVVDITTIIAMVN